MFFKLSSLAAAFLVLGQRGLGAYVIKTFYLLTQVLMNAQLTRMTVPLKQVAQTTPARLSVPALMALKETEKHARVRTHSGIALQIRSS